MAVVPLSELMVVTAGAEVEVALLVAAAWQGQEGR